MERFSLSVEELRKLLGSGNGDAALLYLHIRSGATEPIPGMQTGRIREATTLLQQLGLLKAPELPAQPVRQLPTYSERDVIARLERADNGFSRLRGEVQRRYGRILTTEELKSLIIMVDDLHLPTEVVGMLLSFCIDRARKCGAQRMPSLRTVEREACRWADAEIGSIEKAASFMQEQLKKYAKLSAISRMLHIQDRKLTPSEERNILGWIEMGFGEAEIELAYQRTLESIGHFNWNYTNTILKNWNASGLQSVAQIAQNDVKPQSAQQVRNNQYVQHGQDLSPIGQQAILRMLEEED